VDWLNAHPHAKVEKYGPTRLDIVNAEPDVFLMPYQEPEDIPKLVEVSKPFLLDAILQGWYTDESTWPPKRDAALFDRWFHSSWASQVFDLSEDTIRKEK
jgi:hypothetical protein